MIVDRSSHNQQLKQGAQIIAPMSNNGLFPVPTVWNAGAKLYPQSLTAWKN